MSKHFLFSFFIRKLVVQYIYPGIAIELKQCPHVRNRAGICKRGDYILKDTEGGFSLDIMQMSLVLE